MRRACEKIYDEIQCTSYSSQGYSTESVRSSGLHETKEIGEKIVRRIVTPYATWSFSCLIDRFYRDRLN